MSKNEPSGLIGILWGLIISIPLWWGIYGIYRLVRYIGESCGWW